MTIKAGVVLKGNQEGHVSSPVQRSGHPLAPIQYLNFLFSVINFMSKTAHMNMWLTKFFDWLPPPQTTLAKVEVLEPHMNKIESAGWNPM